MVHNEVITVKETQSFHFIKCEKIKKLRKNGSGSCKQRACSTFVQSGRHRRTGLEILGGGADTNLPDRAEGARTSGGVWSHAPQENFEK